MDYEGRKVSGAGSLFLLLFNEESSANNAGLSGKDRLQQAWEYHLGKLCCPIFVLFALNYLKKGGGNFSLSP